METTITNFLEKLKLGQLQQYKNMAVYPIFTSVNHSPEYTTLKEALDKNLLTVTEVSKGGSVPELMAINKADIPVLLLDGAKLSGAKQNRVLNKTILLKERSETVIPVSCTEQGRWSYRSHAFRESGVILAKNIRWKKARRWGVWQAPGREGDTGNKGGHMFKTILLILFLVLWASVPDLQAPEINEKDLVGYTPYRVTEDGAILDTDGAVRGWLKGNAVYDAQWNIKYRIQGNKINPAGKEIDRRTKGDGV